MKVLFLIGATLMAGACIYGFADYKKANLRKEFQSLYREEPSKVAQETIHDITPVAAPAPKIDLALEEKKLEAISKKHAKKLPPIIKAEDFSRAALEKIEVPLPEPEVKLKP
jgi:hypothetical protein